MLFVPRILAPPPVRQQILKGAIGSWKTMSNSRKQSTVAGETIKVLSVKEAAAYLRVGRNTIYNLLNDGRLSKLDTGFRRRLIRRSELDEIISGTR
jgi:excisionase family DNA binding protein